MGKDIFYTHDGISQDKAKGNGVDIPVKIPGLNVSNLAKMSFVTLT